MVLSHSYIHIKASTSSTSLQPHHPSHDSLQDSILQHQISLDQSGGGLEPTFDIPSSNSNFNPPRRTSTQLTVPDASLSVIPRLPLIDFTGASSSSEHVDEMTTASSTNQQSSHSFLSHQDWAILKREDVRFRTFDSRFSASFLSPSVLAQNGFFYLGADDVVQCAFCKGVVKDWETNDDPRLEHQRLFPSCAFILGNIWDCLLQITIFNFIFYIKVYL